MGKRGSSWYWYWYWYAAANSLPESWQLIDVPCRAKGAARKRLMRERGKIGALAFSGPWFPTARAEAVPQSSGSDGSGI